MDKKNNKKEILRTTTQTTLMMRLLVGGFVVYLGIDIFKQLQGKDMTGQIPLLFFAVLFILIGSFLVLICLYRLIRKQYDDPGLESKKDEMCAKKDMTEAGNAKIQQTEDEKNM